MIHITLLEGQRSLSLSPTDASYEELTELFSEFEELTDKVKGLAVSPARYRPCPEAACVGRAKVDCGGGRLHRLNVNVVELTMVGVDLDDVPNEKLGEILQGFRARGLAFWAWNTFSHDPNASTARARVLFPLSKPLPISHPEQWSRVAWPRLMKWLGVDRLISFDEKCKDPARLYYLPARPPGVEGHEAIYSEGAAIEWEPVVAEAIEEHVVPTVRLEDFSTEDETNEPVDLEDLKDRLSRMTVPSWVPLIKNVLAGKAPVGPPSERKPGDPKRENAWFDVTMALAMAREETENKRACLEVLKDAFVDGARHEGFTTWEKIQDQFERACEKARLGKAERRAKERAQRENLKKALNRALGRGAPPSTSTVARSGKNEASDAEVARSGNPPEDEEDWTERLLTVAQKNGSVTLKNCASNVARVLRYSPEWRGVIRRNLVTRKTEFHNSPLAPGRVVEFEDDDVADVADWLQCRPEEFALSCGDGIVLSRIRAVARANAYDPIKDYLHALRWDGVPRVDTMLERYFAAKTENGAGEDITEYVRMVSRRWAISAAARGLEPGCKVDTVLILEGLQGGEGKTRGFSILGGAFYTGQYIDLHNKDSWSHIASHWIVELGELTTMKKSDNETLKAFLSLTVDKFRKAYGYEDGAYLRRCAFVGSSNRQDYLKDETGNRRYWPVEVKDADLSALKRDRDQIWAEAVHLFKTGGRACPDCAAGPEDRCAVHRWWLTREESLIADKETEARLAPDSLTEQIVEAFLARDPNTRPRELTTLEIMRMVGADENKSQETKLSYALRRLKFGKVQRRVAGIHRRLWVTPDNLLAAPQKPKTFGSVNLSQKPTVTA